LKLVKEALLYSLKAIGYKEYFGIEMILAESHANGKG
jgi:hypothetical protein